MILGTISAVDSDNGLQLIIDGEDAATTKKYSYVSSYVPTANDRVLIEEIGGSYVIVGKLITDVSSSGIARTAETATNATNATNATTAETCTGNAATATTADSLKNGHTSYGALVTAVHSEYDTTLGKTIVTGVTLAGSHNYVYQGY